MVLFMTTEYKYSHCVCPSSKTDLKNVRNFKYMNILFLCAKKATAHKVSC